ncbi:MAG TPA: hypothetical protein DCS87_17200 [Rheinheimera sp.]|nr:hypothetical protein [Rheinheimera sp.]
MKRILCTFAMLWSLSPATGSATTAVTMPIPAQELHHESLIARPMYSPDGHWIAARMHVSDEDRTLGIIDAQTLAYTPVFSLEKDQFLTDYLWLDSKNLLLDLTIDGRFRQVVLVLENSGGKLRSTIKPLKLALTVLSPDEGTGTFLVAYRVSDVAKAAVHRVRVDQLFDWKLPPDTLVDASLPNVTSYMYDSLNKILFATQHDRENSVVSVSSKKLSDRSWTKIFSKKDYKGEFTAVRYIDKTTLMVLSDESNDTVAVQSYDITTQQVKETLYSNTAYDVNKVITDNQGKMVGVGYVSDGVQTTQYFETNRANLLAMLQQTFPNKSVQLLDESKDLKQLLLFVSSADYAGAYYLLDVNTGKASMLEEVLPDLNQYRMYQSQVIKTEVEPGVQLESYLTLPAPEQANKALIVMPHGGPIGVREYNSFNPDVQYLASRGFAVLRVNFRGSSGFGKKFQDSGVGQFGQRIERDISAVVSQVRKQHQFSQSCAMGGSYGGYSSMMLAIQHPDLYQCVVGQYGIYDLPYLFVEDQFMQEPDARKPVEAAVGKYNKGLRDVSPVYLADKVKAPVLLLAGGEDSTARIEHSYRMEMALKAFKRPVETIYYKKAGHGPYNNYWAAHELAASAEFIRKSLNLKEYGSELTDKALRAKVAKDLALLGEGYGYGWMLEANPTLADSYTARSATFGATEGVYQRALTQLNQFGNFQQGVELLEQAAAQGNVEAKYTAAFYYAFGYQVTPNYTKAMDYANQALANGGTARGHLIKAYLYCTGRGVPQDLQRCLELMDLKKLQAVPEIKRPNPLDATTPMFFTTTAMIIRDAKFTQEQLAQFHAMVTEQFNIYPVDFTVDDLEPGYFKDQEFQKNQSVFKFEKERVFGLNFAVKKLMQSKSNAVLVYISLQQANGEFQLIKSEMIAGTGKDGWGIRYQLTSADKPGIYRIELADLSGNKLASQDFTIQP